MTQETKLKFLRELRLGSRWLEAFTGVKAASDGSGFECPKCTAFVSSDLPNRIIAECESGNFFGQQAYAFTCSECKQRTEFRMVLRRDPQAVKDDDIARSVEAGHRQGFNRELERKVQTVFRKLDPLHFHYDRPTVEVVCAVLTALDEEKTSQ